MFEIHAKIYNVDTLELMDTVVIDGLHPTREAAFSRANEIYQNRYIFNELIWSQVSRDCLREVTYTHMTVIEITT